VNSRERRLSWSHGSFAVLPTAGMLSWAEFLVGGRSFRPFARAAWMGSLSDPTIAGHLRELGGEFVCVPFGSSLPPAGMSAVWAKAVGGHENATPHGPSADRDWEIVSCDGAEVRMRLAYDDTSPVHMLERSISGRDGEPVLDFRLDIHARRAGRTSLGLHPIFRLPEAPGALALDAAFATGFTYPGLVPPGKTVALPGRTFASLAAVPGPAGPVDLAHLPPGGEVEDVVQLGGVSGSIVLSYRDEGLAAVLDWDRSLVPSTLLWISDHGATDAPFAGRYRGLGVEPIAAAFDLADEASLADNPVNATGIATAIALSPDRPVSIRYAISARPL
jgi:hypothetical protein